jgi:hypothetical protein
LTFADGQYFIRNNQVQTLLDNDNYERTDAPPVGDVAIFKEPRTGIVHSATVAAVDEQGKVTLVAGLGGINLVSKTTTPESQWINPATVTYYHKRGDSRTAEQRQNDVNRVSQFSKQYQRQMKELGKKIEKELGPPPKAPKKKKEHAQ